MFPITSIPLLRRTYLGALFLNAFMVILTYFAVDYTAHTLPLEEALQVGRTLATFLLLLLTLEGALIFRPVERLLKQQTNALQESEARYQAVIAAMAEGMVMQDDSGAITLCNPTAEALLGLTRDQMMGRTSIDPHWRAVREDGAPFPGENHPTMVTLKTGKPQRDVVMGVHHPDGKLRWILINSMPLINPREMKPHAVVATFADITQQKALQVVEVENKTLQVRVEKELELSKLKSHMMERIAHEFRTPLASIQVAADTLARYRDRMTLEQTQAKDKTIRKSIQHITDMLDEIGIVIRGSFAPDKLLTMQVDLHEICREIQTTLEAQFGLPGKYVVDVPPGMSLYADPLVLGRSIFHVMRNAARFSPPETPVRINAEKTDGGVVLRITNTGMGIPADEQARVFEPFFRATNIGEISGLGLGLTIVHAGIVAHGGSITLESTPCATTTFTLRLPNSA